MNTLDLIQGSSEWLEHRRKFFNASDAPAMMGCSPYKTRTQLLEERATMVTQEVDAATQRRFDDGHKFEALYRPLAASLLGEGLYPVTGVNGKLSASFDGITMGEDVLFEHKTLNDDIRAAFSLATVDDDGIALSGEDLPAYYRVQMEHQLLVSGADKVLFVGSRWAEEDGQCVLKEQALFWYYPDLELRKAIVGGWEQFERDLTQWKPVEKIEKIKAEPIMALPVLAVEISGQVVASNLTAFKEKATEFIASIKTELVTDADFTQADANVKFCEKAEKDLEDAKNRAISRMASVDELMRTIDHIKEQLRAKRLALSSKIKSEKTARKAEILRDARRDYMDYLGTLDATIEPIKLDWLPMPDLESAAHNKRNLDSIRDACNVAVAQSKILAANTAIEIRAKLDWFNGYEQSARLLVPDLQFIIKKPIEDFKLMVEKRIRDHEEAEQRKRDAEAAEKARLEAAIEAAAKVAAAPSTPQADPDPFTAPVAAAPTQVAATTQTYRASTATRGGGGGSTAPVTRPTDDQIVAVLAEHYRVHESKVVSWLLEMDFEALVVTP